MVYFNWLLLKTGGYYDAKRILLVDDESSLRRSLTLGLNQEGYDVEPCENGIDALKKIEMYKENNIDIDTIVLDVKLPDIDGISLGKIIKSKYAETAIVFIPAIPIMPTYTK